MGIYNFSNKTILLQYSQCAVKKKDKKKCLM